MMKKIIMGLAFSLCLLAIEGCKKKVADENPDFVGNWYSEDIYINPTYDDYKTVQIKSNSAGEFNQQSGASSSSFKGKTRISGSTLKMGIKKFSIDEAPVKLGNVGNIWRMKLSGTTYYTNRDASGSGGFCSGVFSVINLGTDTLQAVMDGRSYTLLPNNMVYSTVTCFGCESVYSDNKGNSFSSYNLNMCTETPVVH